jgi:hypothetical protein
VCVYKTYIVLLGLPKYYLVSGGTLLHCYFIPLYVQCSFCSLDANYVTILGHCHACEDYRPMMVHPSSCAHGGGNTTAIDYPDEDSSDSSSSDSDY